MFAPLAIGKLVAGAGTVVGVAWVIFQFIKWAVEFACKRLDVRAAELNEREADVDSKMERWRLSMERDFRALKAKVGVYERATNMLVSALHRENPDNATLSMVDEILRPYRELDPSIVDPDADLLRKLG